MISCILLSAGLSRRFGSPKALARFGNHTVIEQLLTMLAATKIGETHVILGADSELIKPHLLKHKDVGVVYNKDYKFGQTSSFKAGLEGISQDAEGILLLPVDFPMISAQTVDRLIECFLEHRPPALIPTYQGRKGHPPLFHIDLKGEFQSLDNDAGINTVAHRHANATMILPVDDIGVISSFNTVGELESLRELVKDF